MSFNTRVPAGLFDLPDPREPSQSLKQVDAFTDGACVGNPGPGGYGVVLRFGDRRRELSGGFRLTTNNRMEILAAIEALAALTVPCKVTLHSDSQYVVQMMNEDWPRRWRAKGWRRKKNEPALNPDLWERLINLCDIHEVTFVWLRGHAGHVENERCDFLAVTAASGRDLAPDPGYEDRPSLAESSGYATMSLFAESSSDEE